MWVVLISQHPIPYVVLNFKTYKKRKAKKSEMKALSLLLLQNHCTTAAASCHNLAR